MSEYPCCNHCPDEDHGGAGEHIDPCALGCDDGYGEDDNLTDVEADAMTLASAGYGTDEDYGYFGDPFEYEGEW